MVAHHEFSVTAKKKMHSVDHLTEEDSVINQHVLNHSLTMGETVLELSQARHFLGHLNQNKPLTEKFAAFKNPGVVVS